MNHTANPFLARQTVLLLMASALLLHACGESNSLAEIRVEDEQAVADEQLGSSSVADSDVLAQRAIANPNAQFTGEWDDNTDEARPGRDNPTITSPDGRLILRVNSGSRVPTWHVRALRAPTAAKSYDAATRTVTQSGAAGLVDSMLAGPGRQVTNSFWAAGKPWHQMALGFDPRMPGGVSALRVSNELLCVNPAIDPKDLSFDPIGAFECRRFILIHGALGGTLQHALLAVVTRVFGPGVPGVPGPRLAEPEIVSARFLRDFEPMKDTQSKELEKNIEVSLTADSRLLLGNTWYSWSNTPWLSSGWAPSQGRLEIRSQDGSQKPGGATRLCLVQTTSGPADACAREPGGLVKFDERFPFVQYPFRNPSGTLYMGDDEGQKSKLGIRYQWLSFDGTELFGNAFEAAAGDAAEDNLAGHARGARVVLGKSTLGTFKHIDAQANVARGLTCLLPVDEKEPFAIPNGEVSSSTTCKDATDGSRTLSPLGTSTGFWRAFPEQQQPLVPFARRSPLFMMLDYNNVLGNYGDVGGQYNLNDLADGGSGRQRRIYTEVPLDDFTDGHYLVSFHMNEMFRDNSNRIYLFDSRDAGDANPVNKTADTSGNYYTGTLEGGARFSYDRFGGDKKGLVNNGFLGRAVYFKENGRVVAKNLAGALDEAHAELSVELAFQPLTTMVDPLVLARQLGAWALSYEAGKLVFQATTTDGVTQRATWPIVAAKGVFKHVLVTAKAVGASKLITLYVDGASAGSETWPRFGDIKGSLGVEEKLCVGPGCSGAGGASASWLVTIDEVAVSDVARNAGYAATAAFARGPSVDFDLGRSTSKGPTGGVALFTNTPADGLPKDTMLGLDSAELRIPESFRKMVEDARNGDSMRVRFNKIASLGKALFLDDLLTINGASYTEARDGRSCSSCHSLGQGRAEQNVNFSSTIDGGVLGINTPTANNRAFAQLHFLDQRASSLVELSLGPVTNTAEMGGVLTHIHAFINSGLAGRTATASTPASVDGFPVSAPPRPANVTNYRDWFRFAFGKGVDDLSITSNDARLSYALTAFQLSLVAGNSPADRILAGKTAESAGLSASAAEQLKRGYLLFNGKARCVACHAGSNFSDELLHRSGPSGLQTKTPTLRRIASTQPYFRNAASRLDSSLSCPLTSAMPNSGNTDITTNHSTANQLCKVVNFYNAGGHKLTSRLGNDLQETSITSDHELFPLGLSQAELDDLVWFLRNL